MELDLTHPVAIRLPLGAWNTVLNIIAKAPWDTADPLMHEIRRQIACYNDPSKVDPAMRQGVNAHDE